ncbi:PIG-M-domain-containing protein [Kalaharituber pfeilii]|nr:PIG-M-domain-containing protein [Kalaharituber pfeilii]
MASPAPGTTPGTSAVPAKLAATSEGSKKTSSSFWRPVPIFTLSFLLRFVLLLYGLYQDSTSPIKYTDIDYLVFTDAARFTRSPSHAYSPYARETYRYTPLLAWLLLPTTLPGLAWFSFGKVLFALGDLGAGWGIIQILMRKEGMSRERAVKFTSLIWLLNPMVATISTRGSSEGLLGVMVIAMLWAVVEGRTVLAGMLLGWCVHWKIYPIIYAPAILWWMAPSLPNKPTLKSRFVDYPVSVLTNCRILIFALTSLATFAFLTGSMYAIYGFPFLQHTYLHHLTRLDHRHNFSPYNPLLHLVSSPAGRSASSAYFSSTPFLPQLLLSTVLLPLAFAKSDLPGTMFAQTFAFVTFNKVCTSQYFMWYIVLLPFYLPKSSLVKRPGLGVTACVLWVAAQALWLQQGFELEFMGKQTFWPGLGMAGLGFFVVNVWILGVVVGDFAGK